MSAADGAFPATLWQTTPRILVAAALGQIQPTTSPALQSLARRLLLSPAEAPAGDDPATGPNLALLRVQTLTALGQVSDAMALADQLHLRTDPEAVEQLRIQLRFVANDTDGGCQKIQEAIGRYQDVWWDRAFIACQALAGDQAKAAMGQAMLRERNAAPDAPFDSLIDAVAGRPVKIDHMPNATPMDIALLAATKLPLPMDTLLAADPSLLHEWATNPKIANDRRLAAAERAAYLGALSLDDLRDTYTEVSFKDAERKSVLAQSSDSPRSRAILYSIAREETDPAVRAQALNILLQAAHKQGTFPVTARLVTPLLLEINPAPELAWFAPEVIRAFYVAARPAEARQWLQLVDPQTAAALFPLARLAEGASGPAWPAGGLEDVLNSIPAKDGAGANKLVLIAALFAASGETVTPSDWALVAGLPPVPAAPWPNAALVLDQRLAADNHRLGETVLTILAICNAGNALTTQPALLAQAVAGLRAVGLDADARSLAVEAAIDAGF